MRTQWPSSVRVSGAFDIANSIGKHRFERNQIYDCCQAVKSMWSTSLLLVDGPCSVVGDVSDPCILGDVAEVR